MNAWSHLPNAPHIDRVLAHFKAHPDRVLAHFKAHPYRWSAARDAAYDAAWGAAWGAAYDAARYAVMDAARGAAYDAAWDAAWGAALDAICALIAWDDCAGILDMPVDAVKFLAANGHHPAVLLLPAVLAMGEKL